MQIQEEERLPAPVPPGELSGCTFIFVGINVASVDVQIVHANVYWL